MKVKVLNWEGKNISEVEIRPSLFTEKPDKSLLQEVVRWQLARKRGGNHKVKTRAEVSGGGKKPFRQKKLGRARQGSIRSPLLKGGGVVHGPKKRTYDWALSKRVRKEALRQSLSYVFQSKSLFFVENMQFETGKTKELNSRLEKMGWDRALLVDETCHQGFFRACRNLKDFKFLEAMGLNVYDVLKFKTVIFTPSLLETVYRKCGL